MYGESQASGHFLRRRQVLRGAAAGLLSVGMGPLALAAEKSLQRSLEINNDDIFQNLFIEWETVGEVALATALFEKAIS